jgi:hypothetical protein
MRIYFQNSQSFALATHDLPSCRVPDNQRARKLRFSSPELCSFLGQSWKRLRKLLVSTSRDSSWQEAALFSRYYGVPRVSSLRVQAHTLGLASRASFSGPQALSFYLFLPPDPLSLFLGA